MGIVNARDGTPFYYKDWGEGPPVVFSHEWPLTADAWDDQMLFLAGQGFRCVAHDRRGHGRSGQPWARNDMDTYADDLAGLLEALDLKGATLVGHSTGGGKIEYGFTAFAEQGVAHVSLGVKGICRELMKKVIASFKAGKPALDPLATLEMVAFMEDANKSGANHSAPVAIKL